MNKFHPLEANEEKELLRDAQPVVKIILAIISLEKKIAEKEKVRKVKSEKDQDELKKLKSELEKKNQELAEIDQEKLQKGINAIRSLLDRNQNIVKYIARGYSSLKGWVGSEELNSEGVLSLLKAMEKFDLNTKFRFATYAGCWVRQYIQSCINKEQFINQGGVKDKKNVVYYDSGYQNDDQESKSYSLQETLHDEQNNELTAEELRRQDVLIQTNNLINTLGNREAILLNRLLYKIKPSSLVDIYYLADEKEKKELQENLKLSKKFNLEQLKKRPLEGSTIRNLPVVKKYLSLFTKNYKFIEISRILGKSENTTRQLRSKTFQELQKLAKERKLHFLIT
ncbi:Putative RNA polymerase sigma factor rpoD [endosymbiont DhMRE of Dentiscutata heterogama]|uniref:sigma-70 family RNA polymerase sigma factor n=1 Tax=endosymbiont DhMRE of Dentiscutata heterogama TaxID=1609546 RepID=UPI000629D9F5|nr:sigma-70 family RNA polymerase sigma factor [endosymbiont DhMRE of Dentiscutata heterogama]CFW92896.1 Putative RNA polymerase sigma factor rpoD [endosymbiont DhMRE of Dentiscutata heterogama]